MSELFTDLFRRHPELADLAPTLAAVCDVLTACWNNAGTLFLAGNGGSAADAEHICGELLKGFRSRRPLSPERQAEYKRRFGAAGAELAGKLQCGLRAVSLLSHPALATAFANDVDPELGFAQQLYALGRPGDVLLGISTGGNAANIRWALMTARAEGMTTILLTGNRHGSCESLADYVLAVPESETFRVQELHLPLYHALCRELERRFFPN